MLQDLQFAEYNRDQALSTSQIEVPRPPELVYGQTDPANWDPFSRAHRIGLVHEYCTHHETTDENLRRSLDFMERKVELAREQRAETKERNARLSNKRSLFSNRFTKFDEEVEHSQTDREILHSHIAEYILNCIQISEIALSRGFRRASYRCRYYRDTLSDGDWIEDRFLSSKSETKNTFLLLSSLERGLDELREQKRETPHWRLPKKLSKDTLDDTFRSLQSGSLFDFTDIIPASSRSEQTEFDLVESSREAFYSISHEIMENSMSHGVTSTINPHSARSDLENFGSIFFLQTSIETYTTKKANTSIFPEGFAEFHSRIVRRRANGRQRYRVVTFFDTGLGVERHLKKYGDLGEHLTISQITERCLSARQTRGSGHGIEKMKSFANGLGAFLAIATPDCTYAFDGLNRNETEKSLGKVGRGTVVSVFLPER
ncbi:hypothetical protein [uncultured Roseobacter sp.]|uniref:hypothetical protein n=1 Tax=uncultured Roseobacter sp. TaxID=114847 RepID=UPI002634577D|nr:hypothetical protein [uncultured Roseobacter sp.]